MDTKKDFSTDLQSRYLLCKKLAKINYCLAYLFFSLAIIFSIAASLSVATEYLNNTGNAVLAALPGALYLINSTFRFEEKSRWWYEKFYNIESLHRGLVIEGVDQADISRSLTESSRQLAKRWPGFGKAPN